MPTNMRESLLARGPVAATQAEQAAQLEQIAKRRYGFDEFGFFVKPSDFAPAMPCNFYRDSTGSVKHDMDFSVYTTGATSIYVDVVDGNDTSGNGSTETPYKTLKKACDIAAAGGDAAYDIVVVGTTPFMRDQCMGAVSFTDKIISIRPANPVNRIVMCSGQSGLTWAADGDGTWKAARSSVHSVFDFRTKDDDGIYVPVPYAGTVSACKSTPNSWFTDNVDVWVHTSDGLAPTNNTIAVNVASGLPRPVLLGTAKLYFENIDFALLNNSYGGLIVTGDTSGSVSGTLIAKNCTFSAAGRTSEATAVGGALEIKSLENTYLFDCFGGYASNDIYNYHYQEIPEANRRDCFVLEYNCLGKHAGLAQSTVNNNISTMHEGACILRIGTIGLMAKGPTIADIGGSYSICVDCEMADAQGTVGTYWFEENTAGKAIVINCKSDDNSQGLVGNCPTYVYGFQGAISASDSLRIMSE